MRSERSDLPTTACWAAENVSPVLSNEALEGHEGVFLATHTPVRDFEVAGSHAGEIRGRTEGAVLDALADPAREHAFCVVQGEPGSGKSHLIRWLSVNWPRGTDVKLLLQRADGSLEGGLRQLRDELPGEFNDLFDTLGRRHHATQQGRANLLLGNLAAALDPGHFDPPLPDVEWCRQHNPSELVGHPIVRRMWKGPLRILSLLDGKAKEGEGERNSASASFDLFDIEELGRICADIRGTGVLPATERLAARLLDEAGLIEEHRAKEWTAEDLEKDRRAELRTSIALLDALNRRRNDAVHNLLGVSAEGLKRLFREVRAALEQRGQRLVLLLEDITSWEGIDDSLIDVLVTNAGTRGTERPRDMCPLISVVGITPQYYDKLHANYRARITHDLSLGSARSGGELQDVATLRERGARLAFAARYLAAVRVGAPALAHWREEMRLNRDLSPPNRCRYCDFRPACHRTFGHINEVGFFPFTPDALERFFAALSEHDHGMTWKTPRGILQAVLGPNLAQPDTLQNGTFPTALIEGKALPSDTRKLSPRLERVVEVGTTGADQARIRRVFAYWGDRERADTTSLPAGDLAFADVPRGVFEAFGLPWIGDAAATFTEAKIRDGEPPALEASGEADPLTTAPAPLAEIPKQGETTAKPALRGPRTTGQAQGPGVGPRGTGGVAPPPSRQRGPTRGELERQRAQLRTWDETGTLEAPSVWNGILFDLVRAIDPRRVGLDPYTFGRLLTPDQVKIEGTAPTRRAYFSVSRERWVRDGLEAYLALRLDQGMSVEDAEFHRRSLTVLQRRLEALVERYADRRLTILPDTGRRWTPAVAMTQVLLARAWLRGTTRPDDPLPAQLRAVLSDEGDSASDPSARCVPWAEMLHKTKDWHDPFRVALRRMLGTPQGTSSGFGLVDLSEAASAILRLRTTLRFDAPPDGGDVDHGVRELDKVRELISEGQGTLTRAVRIERDQVRQRGEAVHSALRGRSIRAHFERVDRVVETVAGALHAAPSLVDQWKSIYQRTKPRLEAGADGRVQTLLLELAEEAASEREGATPLALPVQLGRLARAPARDLEDVRSCVQAGEQVVAALLAEAQSCIREGAGSASIEDVRRVGRALRDVFATMSAGEKPEAA
ncbi:hypothetical protein A3862_29690 (plasmid) [Methylobacterium sp. XJLW]|uniref:hypothetical protein n=1 Tax=Methylobacterium sp. XJLW TaxID=739141 RepID=UPI000DAB0EB3|nr:hypothetical protein [Methylobacterium sp. XJLW]AWV19816.1 hypothetical protein A3862_29690 [Methylobacterium sp. XJLW]